MVPLAELFRCVSLPQAHGLCFEAKSAVDLCTILFNLKFVHRRDTKEPETKKESEDSRKHMCSPTIENKPALSNNTTDNVNHTSQENSSEKPEENESKNEAANSEEVKSDITKEHNDMDGQEITAS